MALEHACLVQVDGEVESRLSADGWQQRVRLLELDDPLDVLHRHRLDVDALGRLGIRHDGRRVGVDEDYAIALFSQGLTRLRTRVVELTGLADYDRPRPDHQDGL